jgi:hypothetical protein
MKCMLDDKDAVYCLSDVKLLYASSARLTPGGQTWIDKLAFS